MAQLRDIGNIVGHTAVVQYVDEQRPTQVYQATHDGAGKRLPLMQRSFISFSYGGKQIEDFGLIAITENNQIQRNIYADFNDTITELDSLDGQLYWDTHYNANTLSLSLFTDGITEQQLDDFKYWFRPGQIRELILSEHPNRAIMARLSEPPEYSILPFEQKTNVVVMGETYETSTTCYKGRITISFVMDDPFWYSKSNILEIFPEKLVVNSLDNINIAPGERRSGVQQNIMLNYPDSWTLDIMPDSAIHALGFVYFPYTTTLTELSVDTTCEYTFSWPEMIANTYAKSYTYSSAGEPSYTAYWLAYSYKVTLECSSAPPNYHSTGSITLIDKSYNQGDLTQEEAQQPVVIPSGSITVVLPEGTEQYGIRVTTYGMITFADTYYATCKTYLKDSIPVSCWKNANDELVSIFNDRDALKILLEDGIPLVNMKADPDTDIGEINRILIGTDKIINLNTTNEAAGSMVGENATVDNDSSSSVDARADMGTVAYSIADANLSGIDFASGINNALYVYYAGTAPGKPRMTFSFVPPVNTDGYIYYPANSFSSSTNIKCSKLTIEGPTQHEFKFTTPSIWTGYNQAIWIFKKFYKEDPTAAWEEIRIAIRDNVKHYAPRAYAISIIDKFDSTPTAADEEEEEEENIPEETEETIGIATAADLLQAITLMRNFLYDSNAGQNYQANFLFDSKTGEAIGSFQYNESASAENIEDNHKIIEEDVGDMVKSEFLIIEGRNYPNSNGYIVPWSEDNPNASHRLYHTIAGAAEPVLNNFNLEYKYMYL